MLSRERLQERFIEMVKIYSPSKGEKEMADWLENWLSARKIPFQSDRAGEQYGGNGRNIVACLKGAGDGIPLGFGAHMDQIEPCANVQPIVEGSIIRTDGTTTLGGDDKSGLAAILEAVEDILPEIKVVIESADGNTSTILPLDSFVTENSSSINDTVDHGTTESDTEGEAE